MSRVVTPVEEFESGAVETPKPAARWQTRLQHDHWAAALALYTLIVAVLAHSAIGALNTVMLGSGVFDNAYEAWSMWWFREALSRGVDPGHTSMIFALLPSVQVFQDHIVDNLMGVPLISVLTPAGAYDVLVLLSYILGGLFMYLLAAQFVHNRLACFVSGFLFTFSAYHFTQGTAHLGLLTVEFLPTCAWAIFTFYRNPSPETAALAGLGMALVPLSEIYFLPYFLIPFVLIFLGYIVLTNRSWLASVENVVLAVLAVVIAEALSGPYLLSYVQVDPDLRANIQTLGQQDTQSLSADLLGFVLPQATNPAFGGWTAPLFRTFAKTLTGHPASPFLGGETAYLGVVTIVLGLAAFTFRRNRNALTYFLLALAVGSLLLALGPVLHVAGHPIVSPLPYQWLFGWSALSGFRAPSRAVILAVFSLSLLAAYAVEAAWEVLHPSGMTRALFAAATALLLIFAYVESTAVSWTLPSAAVPVSPLYERLASSEPGLLLDLPMVPAGFYQYYQYFQVVHHKPLVEGFAPRFSNRMLQSDNLPILAPFQVNANGVPAMPAPAVTAPLDPTVGLAEAFGQMGIRYAVLHSSLQPSALPGFDFPAATYQHIRHMLLTQLGPPFYDSHVDGLTAWYIPTPPAVALGLRVRLGSGWSTAEDVQSPHLTWVAGRRADLVVTTPQAVRVGLRLTVDAYFQGRSTLLTFNGRRVTDARLARPWQTQTIGLVIKLRRGRNVLHFATTGSCMQGPASRCLSLGIEHIRWVALPVR